MSRAESKGSHATNRDDAKRKLIICSEPRLAQLVIRKGRSLLKDDDTTNNSADSTKPLPKHDKGLPAPPHSGPAIDVEAELRGKTLRAYLFILKSDKSVGVRELQRALGMSSASVAYHHIDKLTRMGLIEKDSYGEYALVKNASVNALQAFTQVGRLLVPRFTFYAVFFTTLLLGYVFIFLTRGINPFAFAFGIFACLFSWYETFRTWKKRPF